MFERVLARIRSLVREGNYVVTLHAQDAMEDDDLTAFDVESCVSTGQIMERQRDRRTREWKYLVRGQCSAGDSTMIAVVKVGPTDKVVVMTVYSLGDEP